VDNFASANAQRRHSGVWDVALEADAMNPWRRSRIVLALPIALVAGFVPSGDTALSSASALASLSAAHSCGVITSRASVPAHAWSILNTIDGNRTGSGDPKSQVKSNTFKNDGRSGTTILPKNDRESYAIAYRKYDINPSVAGQDRGRERLVIGSNGSAYFTGDHYCNWVQIR
jgi:guanyl-specific ribonuclease Sa